MKEERTAINANVTVISDGRLFERANAELKRLYGPSASFRPGQYEAIEAVMHGRSTLVVQRTGWGKSLVYFMCAKLLREAGGGAALIVSPLLSLMQNQLEAAQGMGLCCDTLSSRTRDRQPEIMRALEEGRLDAVLVTPETLLNEAVCQRLSEIPISLFVIDEAHCISDWGHDFRLEYCRLRQVLRALPPDVPLLAATATANDRVTADVAAQLGTEREMFVSRGPLSRASLQIQVLPLQSKAQRYAWLLENVPKLPGSGIIYCLIKRDCDELAAFLQSYDIDVMTYYSRDNAAEEDNLAAEEAFKSNKVKALIATVKLGMGYDKGDIAFVIHFQTPKNVVAYYQQIGRAGRNIDRAFAFLMRGGEDEEILGYFTDSAFPAEKETLEILDHITENGGAKKSELEAALNIRTGRIDKALDFMLNDGFIYKDGAAYRVSDKPFVYAKERYDRLTGIRKAEIRQMKAFAETKECYSVFMARCLDDTTAAACGRCANCLGHDIIPVETSDDARRAASEYLEGMKLAIPPRKHWASAAACGKRNIEHINEPGWCLSKYGGAGWGELVKRDKYSKNERFCNELLERSVSLLSVVVAAEGITLVTCVPSRRSRIVADFAARLADRLGMRFLELLDKKQAEQQKLMENSAHQCVNAFKSFSVRTGAVPHENILLVDDIVDSRWTLTVCGFKLMQAGAGRVYPFALADSSHKEV